MRVLLAPASDPFTADAPRHRFWERGDWPVRWVAGPAHPVLLFRRVFAWAGGPLRLHVSADQRYELFLDGVRIGRGPERGDPGHWHFETYVEDLAAGEHLLVARVWCLADPPHAQISLRHAFLCAGEGAAQPAVSTGIAAWEVRPDAAWAPRPKHMVWGTGSKVTVTIDAELVAAPRGGGSGWAPVRQLDRAVARIAGCQCPGGRWQLEPAGLPPQDEPLVHAGSVRQIADVAADAPVRAADHLAAEAPAWQALLAGTGSVTVPPRTRRLVLVDLGHYRCAYPEVTAAGHGEVRIAWAEALFTAASGEDKGDRAASEGLWFRGIDDAFRFTGTAGTATTLWWEAGRFVRICVETGDRPLVLRGLAWRETGYPLHRDASFASSDARLDAALPVMERVLRRCAHETYMDCPYYEQLQYIGDTRLECLTTRALTRDHRLPDKALDTFAWSLGPDGLLSSRYPTFEWQNIPTFSLMWIGMLHDAWLLGDPARVRPLLGAKRAICERFRSHVRADGLLGWIPGWNFMDWVPSWESGEVPGSSHGAASVNTWLLTYALVLGAELEHWAGEPELAARDRALARRLADGCEACWDEQRGLYRDAPGRTTYSEHAQVLALLSGLATGERAQRLLDGLERDPDLARTTVYFSHYLFEVAARFRRPQLMERRLEYWRALPEQGFTTVPERPEPSRSDCHAWGAHPWYHLLASVLGIRPAAPGFAAVRITPMPGAFARASGSWPHPLGDIRVELDGVHGRVALPAGLPGTLVLDGREIAIHGSHAW